MGKIVALFSRFGVAVSLALMFACVGRRVFASWPTLVGSSSGSSGGGATINPPPVLPEPLELREMIGNELAFDVTRFFQHGRLGFYAI